MDTQTPTTCDVCQDTTTYPMNYGDKKLCRACFKDHSEHIYKITRFYQGSYRKTTIARGLTKIEAQAHCSDPETSSSTCTTAAGRARTRKYGAWFDGYSLD